MHLEFIMHGTGTSSSLPNISCLTSSESPRCPTCWSTRLPTGRKNHRRCTGALVRVRHDEGEEGVSDPEEDSVIVIDAGKTFLAAAHELFPVYGLRKIAAVVLTHAHADATNGLDDLRSWTLNGGIQDHIDIYLARETFYEVKKSFPYLVAKEFATGGGDVPEFRFHFFEEGAPFSINGLVNITPIAVEHGRFFSSPTPVPIISQHSLNDASRTNGTNALTPPETRSVTPAEPAEPIIVPYMAYGFLIDAMTSKPGNDFTTLEPSRIVYMSDVSSIPERSWDIIERPTSLLSSSIKNPYNTPPSLTPRLPAADLDSASAAAPPPTALVIIDCLKPTAHTSHFGLGQAYSACRRLLAPQTRKNSQTNEANAGDGSPFPHSGRAYMVGFAHEFTMAEWDAVGDVLAGDKPPSFFAQENPSFVNLNDNWRLADGGIRPAYIARALDSLVDAVPSIARPKGSEVEKTVLADEVVAQAEQLWMRPGWDGMRLIVRGTEVFEKSPLSAAAPGLDP